MRINIDGTEYDIGSNLNYEQTNADGAYQDKLKYRLTQQNNLILIALKAIAQSLGRLAQGLGGLITQYIWTDGQQNIMVDGEDNILIFQAYSTDSITDLQNRMTEVEQDVQTLAGLPVIIHEERNIDNGTESE